MGSEIKSGKMFIKDIFSNEWFRIPEYQRPYVWGKDQVSELLEDIKYAMIEKPNSEYFLGSFVFQPRKKNKEGIDFIENDILDGQQRITTILLMFLVFRRIMKEEEALDYCKTFIFQEKNKYGKIPKRPRVVFEIRQEVSDFTYKLFKDENFELGAYYEGNIKDISVRNMVKAIHLIGDFFDVNKDKFAPEKYFDFLINNVLMIYVSTENLEDAFRLFTILNDRGMPLRNSDILKSINLGALENDEEKKRYAEMWEKAESELEEDFDRFLSYLRTILVKEKARSNLLQEFEDKIYAPKEKDKAPLLEKGEQTFEHIKEYLEIYQQITTKDNCDITGDFKFYNLVQLMSVSLPSTDWIPPLLRYYQKFKNKEIFKFLILLDNKFSANLILGLTPTERIDAMNNIIKEIDTHDNCENVLASPALKFNLEKLFDVLNLDIYRRSFDKYILLKLDYLLGDNSHRINHENISVEHILPQTPKEDSQWCTDFTEEQRADMTHIIGNLVLISGRKNSSQGRLDYSEKMEKYFKSRIDTCPNSLRIFKEYEKWDVETLEENQKTCLEELKKHYSTNS